MMASAVSAEKAIFGVADFAIMNCPLITQHETPGHELKRIPDENQFRGASRLTLENDDEQGAHGGLVRLVFSNES
jgi:hypothetical protein